MQVQKERPEKIKAIKIKSQGKLNSGGNINEKNSELTYKEMYRQPASFQAVNDTLEDIFKTLDKVFFSEKKYDELIFTGCGTSLYLAQASAAAFSTYTGIPSKEFHALSCIISRKLM